VLDEFEKRWNDILATGATRAGAIATQAKIGTTYTKAREELGQEQVAPITAGGMWTPARVESINAARKHLFETVFEMDRLSKATKITDVDVAKLQKDIDSLDLGTAIPGLGSLFERRRINQDIKTMVKALDERKASLEGTPEAIPESERKKAEAIRQQIDAANAKKAAQTDSATQTEREAKAVGEVKTDISNQVSLLNTVIERVGALADAWSGVSVAMSGATPQLAAAGGAIQQLAVGGLLRRFDVGGFVSSGTDTVPAMLTPGERVINADSSRRFASQLIAMNAGIKPVFRSEGGSVTNVGDINVTVSGGGSSHQTARSIAVALKRELRRGTSTL